MDCTRCAAAQTRPRHFAASCCAIHSARDDRWHDRYASIDALVESAAAKYGGEQVEHRRAIACLVHRMAEARRPYAEIHAAVLLEAERRRYSADSAKAITERILAKTVEPAHA